MINVSLLTDIQLISRLKQDDREAYTQLYERYKQLLFIHAYKRLADTQAAQDVVQDIFIRLWDKRQELDFHISARAYLYTTVRNQIFNLIAKKQVESNYLASLQDHLDKGYEVADHQARYQQLLVLIEKEIAQLPLKMQEVFNLSRNEHLSHREIAEELNISEHTVKKQVQNALKILRKRIGPLCVLLFV